MKEKLSIIPQPEADLSDEQEKHLRQRAQDLTQEESEMMDWQTGDPEKRDKIRRRHEQLEVH